MVVKSCNRQTFYYFILSYCFFFDTISPTNSIFAPQLSITDFIENNSNDGNALIGPGSSMQPSNGIGKWEDRQSEYDTRPKQKRRRLTRRRSRNCPPDGFDALTNFNLTTYVSNRWYVQRQKPVIYSGEETFCSYAQYTIDENNNKKPFCLGLFCERDDILRINVKNRGLMDSVSGDENIALLTAVVPNPKKEPAKVSVAFQLPGRTNYWIVAAGSYQDAMNKSYVLNSPNNTIYEWALISGGIPNVETSRGKCVAGTLGKYDTRGLWMFTGSPKPPDGVITAVTEIAEEILGLDTTVWRNVTHEGCTDY